MLLMPDLLIISIALFYAWLFGLAAWHKFSAPAYYAGIFGRMIERSPGSHNTGVGQGRIIVMIIAVAEAGLALALLLGVFRSAAIIGGALLLLAYAIMLGWQIRRGRRDLDCGCAGPDSRIQIGSALVYRNLVCASLGTTVLLPVVHAPLTLLTATFCIIVAAFLAGAYGCCEQLIANAQRMAAGHQRNAIQGT
jgi:uncharacterized membrane protein YphA (DoxX/SURF4 family)